MKLNDCKIGVSVIAISDIPSGINYINGFIITKPFIVKTCITYYNNGIQIATKIIPFIAVRVSLADGSVQYFDIRKLQKL